MRISSILEAISSKQLVFHATSLEFIKNILTTNTLRADTQHLDTDIYPELKQQKPISSKTIHGVSLTRDKYFAEAWADVILVLDLNVVKQNYKVKQVAYFADDAQNNREESEEFVIGNIKNLKKCLVGVYFPKRLEKEYLDWKWVVKNIKPVATEFDGWKTVLESPHYIGKELMNTGTKKAVGETLLLSEDVVDFPNLKNEFKVEWIDKGDSDEPYNLGTFKTFQQAEDAVKKHIKTLNHNHFTHFGSSEMISLPDKKKIGTLPAEINRWLYHYPVWDDKNDIDNSLEWLISEVPKSVNKDIKSKMNEDAESGTNTIKAWFDSRTKTLHTVPSGKHHTNYILDLLDDVEFTKITKKTKREYLNDTSIYKGMKYDPSLMDDLAAAGWIRIGYDYSGKESHFYANGNNLKNIAQAILFFYRRIEKTRKNITPNLYLTDEKTGENAHVQDEDFFKFIKTGIIPKDNKNAQ